MQITINVTDEKQIKQFEGIRGDKTAEEIALVCFAQGLNFLEFQHRQVAEASKHPLLQFPEAKAEFKEFDGAAVDLALKEKAMDNKIVIEVTRLVSGFIAQVNEFARLNGNKLPPVLPVNPPASAVEKAALQIAISVIRNAAQKPEHKKAAA